MDGVLFSMTAGSVLAIVGAKLTQARNSRISKIGFAYGLTAIGITILAWVLIP